MARKTLEAVFGALGAGLTGYGRERQQLKEDEQRLRRESDLTRIQMLNMGFDPEGEATRRSQGLTQAGRMAQAAPPVPGMPSMSMVGQALSQAGQDLPRGRSITVGGERFVQPLSRMPETMAQRQVEQAEVRDIRAEGRSAERFKEQEKIRTEGAVREIRERATAQARTAPTSIIKPPTEGQERNAVYYGLMSNATQELDSFKNNPDIRPWMITAYLNTPGATFGRGLLNDSEQQFIRAAQDFTAGVLRKETGAAATKPEVAQTLERYIEMGGDQPGSRAAKQAARERVTATMEKAATPALRYYQSLEGVGDEEEDTISPQTRPPLSSFYR